MNKHIQINQSDHGIRFQFLCRDENGRPIDLSHYSVDFLLYDGETQINQGHTLCSKPDAIAGVAEYEVTTDDTLNVGIYMGKLKLGNSTSDVHNMGILTIEVQGIA